MTSDQERVAAAQQPVAWQWRVNYRDDWSATKSEFSSSDLSRGMVSDVHPLYDHPSSEPELRAEIVRLTRERDELRACEASWEQTRLAIAQMRNENGGLRSRVEALSAEVGKLTEDAERLNWLEAVNLKANERNGTVYGWKFDINHNRAALTDHNLPALTVREAIDSARFPERASEITLASLKEGARLTAFDERFPGVRIRSRAALDKGATR